MLALAVDAARVRAEEFVRRAREEIAVESADVNRSVRRVVNRVDERERAGVVSHAHDFFHGIDCAHGIRRVAHGDEAWSAA